MERGIGPRPAPQEVLIMAKAPPKRPRAKREPSLRKRAEAILRQSPKDITRMSGANVQKLVHELQVHHIELEMQNEELRCAQEDLVQSRDRFQDLYDFAPIGYVTLGQGGIIQEANLTLATMLGVERSKLAGQRFTKFVARVSQDALYRHQREVGGSEGKQTCELVLRRADATEFVAMLETIRVHDSLRRMDVLRSSVNDITERKRAEEALTRLNASLENQVVERTAVLRRQQAKLEGLTAKLITAQEEERRRIARELHDDITQRLAALAIDLQRLHAQLPTWDAGHTSRLEELGKSAEQLTTDLQHLAHQLHPSILEHVGLEAAIREHAEEFAARTGLKTEVIVRNMSVPVPIEQATCLYRVLQEGLQNVRKHANATSVLVRLLTTGGGIGLCVHDDGRGFEHDREISRPKGLGLTSMEERVRALQGTFRVKTKPGDGTELHAWVPLEDVKREM